VNVEGLFLNPGHGYTLTMNDANVAAGQTFDVTGGVLGAGDKLIFDASHETDGSYFIEGGAGNDVLYGGQAGNTLAGGMGQDRMTGGAGADMFDYASAAQSTGVTRDIITGFDALHDSFNLSETVTGIDPAVTTGSLNAGHMDANLGSAIDAAHLAAGHAVLFTPSAGYLAGHTFLVVDANGTAGYQAGQDYVIQLESSASLESIGLDNFA
jgi:Ca2+-binding RTX toxin-like protein